MAEFDRLNGCIEWIDLSFVERTRTPEWAIQVGNDDYWLYGVVDSQTNEILQFNAYCYRQLE
jgi:hypothetical protein